MKLILIRHGETDYNLHKRYCGKSNPSLNKSGVEQSIRLAERCKSMKVDKVFSSSLDRAVETAEIVFKGEYVEKLDNFSEMDFGCFEGLTYKDIMGKYPEIYRSWIDNPVRITIPDGESFKKVRLRVKRGLVTLLSQNEDKTIALVSHDGTIRIILSEALNISFKDLLRVKQNNCALNILDYSDMKAPSIIKMNDIEHLGLKNEK